MVGTNNNEHDKSYRDILSNKNAFLHVLKKYVGEPWVDGITPDNIERVDTSFVTSEFRDLDSDLIFKLKKNKEELYFYVLLELQSTVDYTMPFRLLKYMVALLNDVFKNTPEEVRVRKGFKLPAVVPMVLYNGEDNWTTARTFREYTKNHELFGNYIIDFTYHLFDIQRTDKNKILTNRTFPDQIFAFDRSRFDKIDVEEMAEILLEDTPYMTEEERRIITGWLSRAVFIGIDPEKIKKTFVQTLKKGDKKAMKHAATVFMENMLEEGKKEKAVAIAKKLLEKGIAPDTVAESTDLDITDVLRLKSEI